MKISLITASFNSIQHIADVLDSIGKQTYQTIEFIVVDGGSTDGTVKYLKQSNLIDLIISEKDMGIYDALNKGIKLATGDIIGFLHSDDMLDSPQTLQNIVAAFSISPVSETKVDTKEIKNERVDVVYGDLIYVNKTHPTKIIRYWKSKPFNPRLLRQGWMPPHPTVFMRREVYEKHGFFDVSFNIAADYDFLLRVLNDQNLRINYLPEVITKMRIGGVSNRSIKNIIQKSKEDYRAIRKNNIPFPGWVLFLKNISKISQFV